MKKLIISGILVVGLAVLTQLHTSTPQAFKEPTSMATNNDVSQKFGVATPNPTPTPTPDVSQTVQVSPSPSDTPAVTPTPIATPDPHTTTNPDAPMGEQQPGVYFSN